MNSLETALRSIKDRVASALGALDESAADAETKENHRRLTNAALELHRCADEMQNLLMRVRPK